MPPLRPAPVDLCRCSRQQCSRWAAHARLLCGARQRCPVILAVEPLCPASSIGHAAYYTSPSGGHVHSPWHWHRAGGRDLERHPVTLRVLVGPLYLAMVDATPLPPDAPLPIFLDWWEEAGWIDCVERRLVEDLAGLLPFDVIHQRAQLGHLSPTWPRQAPRPFAIQHAYPLLIDKGSL